jgi:hypothetical protein
MTPKLTKHERLEQILTAMGDKEMSRDEISMAIGLAQSGTWTYIEILHQGYPKRIYLSGARVSRYGIVKLYRVGDKEDAPLPARLKSSDLDDEVEFKRKPVVVNVRRDPLTAALFGEAA